SALKIELCPVRGRVLAVQGDRQRSVIHGVRTSGEPQRVVLARRCAPARGGIAVVRCQDHALRVLHLTAARPADDGQASAGWLVQRLQQDAPATGERNELERPRTPELGVALPENDELPAGGGEDEGRRGG